MTLLETWETYGLALDAASGLLFVLLGPSVHERIEGDRAREHGEGARPAPARKGAR